MKQGTPLQFDKPADSRRLIRILAASLLSLVVLPVPAKVLDSAPNGFTIENSVEVPVDARTAWNALVDDVGRWWPSDHTWSGKASNLSIQARAGGCFCEINDGQQASHMTVSYVEPGVMLRMTGGLGPLQGMGLSGVMEWRFAAAESGSTRITLFYRAGGYTPDDLSKFVPVVDQVQAQQLGGLGNYLRPKAR
jgi:uncharacterized protein YndB with AHSA1/START domain